MSFIPTWILAYSMTCKKFFSGSRVSTQTLFDCCNYQPFSKQQLCCRLARLAKLGFGVLLAWVLPLVAQLDQSLLSFVEKNIVLKADTMCSQSWIEPGLTLRYQVYPHSVKDFKNSRRHNYASLVDGPMESRKQTICSFMLSLWQLNFWNLGTLYSWGTSSQTLYQDKMASPLGTLMLWRIFPFFSLNMASTLAFGINIVGSSDKLVVRLATDRF